MKGGSPKKTHIENFFSRKVLKELIFSGSCEKISSLKGDSTSKKKKKGMGQNLAYKQ